ncbi:hypothetical protein Btru_058129 [Bulinus truncatus]|nr:hypothetical protein Btru_058129 [Bulinus truncatus]
MSPRGRHMDCIGPLGHDRLDCGGLGYAHERPDYSRAVGASDPLERVPDRIDYAEHGHMHHMGHDRFIDCGSGANPPPPTNDRLGGHHDFDGALIEERLGCGDPDANMNTMGKMGPHLRQSSGHLMAEDDIKDEYHFTGYGLIPTRSCLDYPKASPLARADGGRRGPLVGRDQCDYDVTTTRCGHIGETLGHARPTLTGN